LLTIQECPRNKKSSTGGWYPSAEEEEVAQMEWIFRRGRKPVDSLRDGEASKKRNKKRTISLAEGISPRLK